MKKKLFGIVLTLCLCAGSAAAADGVILLSNNLEAGDGGLQPIFNTDNTTKLGGDGFSAQLYFGAQGTTDPMSLNVVGPVVAFIGAPIGALLGADTVTIPGISVGQVAALQLRAWDNMSGTINSWEAATVRGESNVFDSQGLGDSQNPATQGKLVGIQSFQLENVAMIPEPSTVALGIIGGLALLMRRRRS